MGQQHNTHIANASGQIIQAVLTDNDNRNTSQIIEPKNFVNIPTGQARVTLSVFRKVDGEFQTEAEATYTDDSDRSFIVKLVDGQLNIVRTKYGTIWEEESGLRH